MRTRSTLIIVFTALVGALGCAKATTPDNVGGETHFLHACDDSVACGAGLDCVCGVCTKACVGDLNCSDENALATCAAAGTPNGACANPVASPVCDVSCARDVDCASIGSGYTCESGSCRKVTVNACLYAGVYYSDEAARRDPCVWCRCKATDEACVNAEHCFRDGGTDSGPATPPGNDQCEPQDHDAGGGGVALPGGFTEQVPPAHCPEATAALAGPGVEMIYNGNRPGPFEVTDSDLYLFDERNLSMVRVPLATRRAWETSALGIIAGGLKVHGCQVYVANTTGEVHSVGTDGRSAYYLASGAPSDTSGIDQVVVDNDTLYLAHYQALYRVPRAGGNVEQILSRNAGGSRGQSMLSLPGEFLWVENTEGTVTGSVVSHSKAALRAPYTLASGPRPLALAIDGADVYIAFAGTYDDLGNHMGDGTIARVTLGSETPETVVSIGRAPNALHVDDTHVYWSQQEAGNGQQSRQTLWRAPKDGSAGATMLADHVETFDVDATHVYWSQHCANYPYGFIVRVPKAQN